MYEHQQEERAPRERKEMAWRIQVPSKSISLIIGSKGAIVKDLQDRTGAVVDIDKQGQFNEQMVSFKGSQESKSSVFHEVMKILESSEACLVVGVSSIALIIGSRGAMVNQLQSDHNVAIDIPKNQNGPVARCIIKGELSNIESCVAAIYGLIETDPRSNESVFQSHVMHNQFNNNQFNNGPYGGGGQQFGGFQNFGHHDYGSKGKGKGHSHGGSADWVLVVPESVTPALIGTKGALVREVSQQSGCTVDIGKHEDRTYGNENKGVTFKGSDQSKVNALRLMLHALAGCREFSGPKPTPPVRFAIPAQLAPKIVGARGATVQQITSSTHVSLSVSREDEVGNDSVRLVTISGDVSCICAAVHQVYRLVGEGQNQERSFQNRSYHQE